MTTAQRMPLASPQAFPRVMRRRSAAASDLAGQVLNNYTEVKAVTTLL